MRFRYYLLRGLLNLTEIDLLQEINANLGTISLFLQVLSYGIFLALLIYFGYWFFSRFFW